MLEVEVNRTLYGWLGMRWPGENNEHDEINRKSMIKVENNHICVNLNESQRLITFYFDEKHDFGVSGAIGRKDTIEILKPPKEKGVHIKWRDGRGGSGFINMRDPEVTFRLYAQLKNSQQTQHSAQPSTSNGLRSNLPPGTFFDYSDSY